MGGALEVARGKRHTRIWKPNIIRSQKVTIKSLIHSRLYKKLNPGQDTREQTTKRTHSAECISSLSCAPTSRTSDANQTPRPHALAQIRSHSDPDRPNATQTSLENSCDTHKRSHQRCNNDQAFIIKRKSTPEGAAGRKQMIHRRGRLRLLPCTLPAARCSPIPRHTHGRPHAHTHDSPGTRGASRGHRVPRTSSTGRGTPARPHATAACRHTRPRAATHGRTLPHAAPDAAARRTAYAAARRTAYVAGAHLAAL